MHGSDIFQWMKSDPAALSLTGFRPTRRCRPVSREKIGKDRCGLNLFGARADLFLASDQSNEAQERAVVEIGGDFLGSGFSFGMVAGTGRRDWSWYRDRSAAGSRQGTGDGPASTAMANPTRSSVVAFDAGQYHGRSVPPRASPHALRSDSVSRGKGPIGAAGLCHRGIQIEFQPAKLIWSGNFAAVHCSRRFGRVRDEKFGASHWPQSGYSELSCSRSCVICRLPFAG